MSGNFFDGAFFNGGFFGENDDVAVKTGTGGIDPPKRRTIYKPTGLVDGPRTRVEERVAETHEIAQQIAKAFQEEFTPAEIAEPPPIEAMTMAEIDAEIGVLLRKKLRDEEDEAAMMLIMLASDL